MSDTINGNKTTLTHEEHETRAMLLGMIYHHGNGDPFYWKRGEDGIPITESMIDANTLEPLMLREPTNQSPLGYRFKATAKGSKCHNMMWDCPPPQRIKR